MGQLFFNISKKLITTGRNFGPCKFSRFGCKALFDLTYYRMSCCRSTIQYEGRRTTSTKVGPDASLSTPESIQNGGLHRAAIALGSNMGDRVHYIEKSLEEMKKRGLRILSVSKLYQTKAMYYENQDHFINGACYVETALSPHRLLDVLQSIENDLGRVRGIDKGPRTLDLDILLYDDSHIVDDRLEVPHKLMLEREFVLRPLADILPDHVLPISFKTRNGIPHAVGTSLHDVSSSKDPMYPVTRLSPRMPLLISDDPARKTMVMSILNITPDSFSDGGKLSEQDIEKVQQVIRRQIEAGATILDIGGQSTRPNADLLSASEELFRVLPVVKAVRSMPEADTVAISIDTFYSDVARETVACGADIINDVSAGLLDPKMFDTVSELGKTIILMHMRGNPHTMTQLTEYPKGVLHGVATELGDRVQKARDAGIHPWRIMLDPGIGFAKTQPQNLELLRGLGELRRTPAFAGMPWLLGVSKKGFIGKITGVQDANKRGWGTAAAVTASIAGGADMVRVHDVNEMAQVTAMADAIYRTPSPLDV